MRNVPFSSTDFELFDPDISPQDYEFFQKHTGAFKRLLEDQSQQQKLKYVSAFKEFAVNHSCIEGFPIKSDNLLPFVDEVINYLNLQFALGKASSAKGLVMDAVCLQQNRSLLQRVGSSSYAKDPFIHKDTRDVFRRLFGQPSEQDACLKAMFVLPLYVKFGGSICRYLRRWLEAENQDTPPAPTASLTVKLSAHSKSTVVHTSNSEANRSKSIKEICTAAVSSKAKTKSEESKSCGATMVAVATFGRGKTTKAKQSSSDEEGDSWETKFMRGLSSATDCLEVYKLDKDGSYTRLRDQFHLDKPHPNKVFEEKWKKKEALENKQLEEVNVNDSKESKDSKDSKDKRHACANCRKVEPSPQVFKKCQRCKGKGTRFYCSRKCQGQDWVSKHRAEHL